MPLSTFSTRRNKMVIIAGYLAGETYGLLGPQMAATIITDNTDYDCIVVALTRDFDKGQLKKSVTDLLGSDRPVVAFSTLSGREDLFLLAKEFTDQGTFTILAGPQADVDFLGEKGWHLHDHRFKGLWAHFSCALHGPAEQIIPLLNNLETDDRHRSTRSALLSSRRLDHPQCKATLEQRLSQPYSMEQSLPPWGKGFVPAQVSLGQVVQQLGCPHASRERSSSNSLPHRTGRNRQGQHYPAGKRMQLLRRGRR